MKSLIIRILVYIAILGSFYILVDALIKEKEVLQNKLEKAEETIKTLTNEKNNLQTALDRQEELLNEVSNNKQVIYKTIYKETSSNEESKYWYDTIIPNGMLDILKNSN